MSKPLDNTLAAMASFEQKCLSDTSVTHTRALDYSYRVPTPPRIIIPPPSVSLDNNDFGLQRIVPPEDQQLDLSFLEQVNYAFLAKKMSILDWTYERRRQAQAILPFLYLGPMPAARNREFLQNEGITMLLAVRPQQLSLTSAAYRVSAELGLTLETIISSTPHDLISGLGRAIHLIQQHLCQVYYASNGQRLGKVFIFCESGNDRSAAVTAAYLMETFDNVDFIKAMQIVQSQRFCVNFDDVHKNLLRAYWEILEAKRAVAQDRQQRNLVIKNEEMLQRVDHAKKRGLGKSKRTLDDSYDEGMDIDESLQADDEARFEGRSFMPFRDGS